MSASASRPSALQMAMLWETRLGKDAGLSLPSPIPLSPTPLTPPLSPPSDSNFSFPSTPRRLRKRVSANKPPVAPPLAPNPVTPNVQEVKLAQHSMLDASSPVSSFHSSAPSSPPVQNLPEHNSPHLHDFFAQVEQLHRDLARCHQRMDALEIHFRTISARMRNVRVYNLH